jgi:hypothetical protein
MSLLSEKVVREGVLFMGPAAPLFLERVCRYHLNGISLEALEPALLSPFAQSVEREAVRIIGQKSAERLAENIRCLRQQPY